MPTPHNNAQKGQIAKTVLMPGDPLRAKFIADTFLQDAVLVNEVRGMLAYTGTYNGKPVTVMGSGMGMPSIGIYSYELFKEYDVDRIIRIGSAGSYSSDAKIYDVVLATSAVSESTYAKVQSGYDKDESYPSKELNDSLRAAAKRLGINMIEGAFTLVTSSTASRLMKSQPIGKSFATSADVWLLKWKALHCLQMLRY